MSIEGRTVVVIGGSSGIGLATARAALQEGARVVIASRSRERLDAALETLGSGAEAHEVDITDEVAVSLFFDRIGPLDHLVTTTAARATGPLLELDLDAARRGFEAKLWGPLLAIRAALPRMGWESSVTLTAGVAAWSPMPGGAATAAVNGAVAALVRTLAVELAPVRVNAVSPGMIDTPTWSVVPPDQRSALFGRVARALPAGRIGDAGDVAAAYLYLMKSGFTTGEVLHVDGGHKLVAASRER